MTVFNNAINTSMYCPCDAAAIKIQNLLKKPAKNGIPPKENTDNIITRLSFGLDLYNPLNAEINVFPPFLFSTADITPKAAKLENT